MYPWVCVCYWSLSLFKYFFPFEPEFLSCIRQISTHWDKTIEMAHATFKLYCILFAHLPIKTCLIITVKLILKKYLSLHGRGFLKLLNLRPHEKQFGIFWYQCPAYSWSPNRCPGRTSAGQGRWSRLYRTVPLSQILLLPLLMWRVEVSVIKLIINSKLKLKKCNFFKLFEVHKCKIHLWTSNNL